MLTDLIGGAMGSHLELQVIRRIWGTPDLSRSELIALRQRVLGLGAGNRDVRARSVPATRR